MSAKGNKSTDGKVFVPASSVRWVVEEDGILLVQTATRSCLKLNQMESAIWQLNAAKVPCSRICLFLAAVKRVPVASAEDIIREKFMLWEKREFLAPCYPGE